MSAQRTKAPNYLANYKNNSAIRTHLYRLRDKYIAKQLRKALKPADKRDNFRYFEFGPGNGRFFFSFSEKNDIDFAGFLEHDPSISRFLERVVAGSRPIDTFSIANASADGWSHTDMNNEQISNGQFDYVISMHIIEHLVSPIEHLQSIWDLLRKGGVAFIATPNLGSNAARKFGKEWRGYADPTHISLLSFEELTAKIKEVGFEIVVAGTSNSSFADFSIFGGRALFEQMVFNKSYSGEASHFIIRRTDR